MGTVFPVVSKASGGVMADQYRFDEPFFPVPQAAVDADPATAMKKLLHHVGKLERSLADERLSALADLGEVLLEVASLTDDITHIIERWGVITNAQQAGMVRSVVALGKKLMEILKYHQVAPINTIGEPLDPETSDAVGTDVQEDVPANTVLREEQIGYTWAYGLLRRAKVIVAGGPDSVAADQTGQD